MRPDKRNNGHWWRFRVEDKIAEEAATRQRMFYGESESVLTKEGFKAASVELAWAGIWLGPLLVAIVAA